MFTLFVCQRPKCAYLITTAFESLHGRIVAECGENELHLVIGGRQPQQQLLILCAHYLVDAIDDYNKWFLLADQFRYQTLCFFLWLFLSVEVFLYVIDVIYLITQVAQHVLIVVARKGVANEMVD